MQLELMATVTFSKDLSCTSMVPRVQIVLQNIGITTSEDHPMHLHKYQFAVVGMGFGNSNSAID